MLFDGFRLSVLLDPSLLLGERSFDSVMEYVKQRHFRGYGYRFYIPPKFVELLEDINEESEEVLFYLDKAKSINLSHLRDVINILRKKQALHTFEIKDTTAEKYATFYGNLLRETGNKTLTEILFQEWIFLNENNFMISRIKKPFNYFIRAGAVCIEFSGKNPDPTSGREEIIPEAEKLKILAKWIAMGGTPTKNLTDPIESNILGEGCFLLAGSE